MSPANDHAHDHGPLMEEGAGEFQPNWRVDMEAVFSTSPTSRARTLAYALRLEYLTVGWNVIEGIVAVAAALAAGSVATRVGREGLRGESCCDADHLVQQTLQPKDDCCDAGHCH